MIRNLANKEGPDLVLSNRIPTASLHFVEPGDCTCVSMFYAQELSLPDSRQTALMPCEQALLFTASSRGQSGKDWHSGRGTKVLKATVLQSSLGPIRCS